MRRYSAVVVVLALCAWVPVIHASQPLETETARLLPAGTLRIEATYEYQQSPEGNETAVPFGFEYGITNSLALLVEPVFYTTIRPEIGRKAIGVGDLEMTLFYRFFDEKALWPALAIAGEVKVPTATDPLIGTGETDYTPFLIASKRIGRCDVHLNFGYGILGEPPGVTLNNIFTYAAALEYHVIDRKLDLVAELVGNTSSSPSGPQAEAPDVPLPGEPGSEAGLVPEAAGQEITGTLGMRYYIRSNAFLSVGITYDNNSALLVRPGFTYRFSDILRFFRPSNADPPR